MREIEKILKEIDESTRDIIGDLESDVRNDKAFVEMSNLAEITEKYGRVYQNFKLIEGEPFGVPFDEKALIAQKLLYISLYLNNWPQAYELLLDIGSFGPGLRNDTIRSFSAFYLIYSALSNDDEENAQKAYQSLSALKDICPEQLIKWGEPENNPLVFDFNNMLRHAYQRKFKRRLIPSLNYFERIIALSNKLKIENTSFLTLNGKEDYWDILGKATINFIHYYAVKKDIIKFESYYKKIESIFDTSYASEIEILGKIALLKGYSEVGDPEKARLIYDKILMDSTFKTDPIYLEFSKSFYIISHINSGDIKSAQRLFVDWDVVDKDEDVLLPYAKTCEKFISALANIGDLDDAKVAVKKLDNLATSPFLVFETIKAYYSIFNAYYEQNWLQKCKSIFTELLNLTFYDVPSYRTYRLEYETKVIIGSATLKIMNLSYKQDETIKSKNNFVNTDIVHADSETTNEFISLMTTKFDEYINLMKLERARNIFNDMSLLSLKKEAKEPYENMAFSLIEAYQKRKKLARADDIYTIIRNNSTDDEFKAFNAKIVKNIMETSLKSGDVYKGLNVFIGLSLDEIPINLIDSIAHIAATSITCLLHLQDLDSAEKYFTKLKYLCAYPKLLKNLERVALNLILAFDSVDQSERATKVFKGMSLFALKGKSEAMRAFALQTLVSSFARKGKIEESLSLSEYMDTFGHSDEAFVMRVKLILEMVRVFNDENILKSDKSEKVNFETGDQIYSPEKILESLAHGNLEDPAIDFNIFSLNDILPKESFIWAKALEDLSYYYLEKNKTSEAMTIFMKMGDTFNKNLRAFAVSRMHIGEVLIESLIKNNQIDDALKVYKIMFRVGYTPEMLFIKARSCAKLSAAYAKIDNSVMANKMLDSFKEFPITNEISSIKAMAVGECINNIEKNFEFAFSLYDSLHFLPQTYDVLHWIGMSAVNIMIMFIDSEKYDEAIIFYNQVSKRPEFKNLPEQIRGNMTIALWKILDGELNANKMNIAKKVCKLIISPYLPEDESTFYGFISILEMIEGYLQNGKIDKAETIFFDLIKRGSDIFPTLQITKIGTRLMDVLMEKDILNKTLDIYKALETLKSSPEIELEKAKAVYRTSIKFSTLGHMDKGLKFINKIDNLVENEDIKSLKNKAIVHIICDYIKLDQIDSAIKLYKTIENVNSPIEDVYHTLEASLKLMKACLKENKNETAKEILTNVVKLSKIKDKKIEKTISEMKKIYAKSVHPDS